MLVLTRKVGEEIVIPSLDVSVSIQSVKGRRVRLAVSAPPEIPVHRDEVWSRINPEPQPDVQELPMESVRVLLADADAPLAAHYENHLSRLGYEVTVARDGLSCVARLREWTPHLVVLDAGLLWGRAEGVLALMDEHADVPDVPVLLTYDEDQGPALSSLQEFGVCDFAAKPLPPQQLAARVRELIPFQVEDSVLPS